jgi:hypothetical protein
MAANRPIIEAVTSAARGGPSPAVPGELRELHDEGLCTEQAYDGVIPESTTSHF